MEETILSLQYPKGRVPARGFRCPTCGEEVLLLEDASEARRTAENLGLFGVENARRRKLQKTGNSITVSLDPELLRSALLDAKPGDQVSVGRQGNRIVITRD
jgi:hypothetical protein